MIEDTFFEQFTRGLADSGVNCELLKSRERKPNFPDVFHIVILKWLVVEKAANTARSNVSQKSLERDFEIPKVPFRVKMEMIPFEKDFECFLADLLRDCKQTGIKESS